MTFNESSIASIYIFPSCIHVFLRRFRSTPYKFIIEKLKQHNPQELSQYQSKLFNVVSCMVTYKPQFEVFVSNWFPFNSVGQDEENRTCSEILECIAVDAWNNFYRSEAIQTEKNLYLLFQLVTLAYVLRNLEVRSDL